MPERDWHSLIAEAAARAEAASTESVPDGETASLATLQNASRYIDHTVLKPEATAAQVEILCDQAARWQFKTVCVNGRFVAQAAKHLADSGVGVAAVVGFPLGAAVTASKAYETDLAIQDGASEIDMVLPVGPLLAKDYDTVAADIAAVNARCKADGRSVVLKVIFETSLLSGDDIIAACAIAKAEKADFVKTSTGFSSAGATTQHIRLMRAAFNGDVKASGGIRTARDFEAMVQAGATRVGCSASVTIMQELAGQS